MQQDAVYSSDAPWYQGAWRRCKATYENLFVLSNREPLLTIRRVVWCEIHQSHISVVLPIRSKEGFVQGSNFHHLYQVKELMQVRVNLMRVITAGWVLFSLYAAAALAMISTIIFIPFVPSMARFALLALDTVTIEHYVPAWEPGVQKTWSNDPLHPFCIIANVVWLLVFGWGFAVAHLAAAVVQLCTIVNAASAVTNVQLALFVLWPFGQGIRRRFLPTTIEELRDHESNEAAQRQPLNSSTQDDIV